MSCGLLRLPTLDTPLAPAAHFNLLPIPPPPSTVPPLHPPFYSKLLPTTTSMSTILRTLRNLRKIGIKEYAHQLQNIGDTKAGTYIASDRYGNKYYENLEQELPCSFPPSPYPDQPHPPPPPKIHPNPTERTIHNSPSSGGPHSAHPLGRLQRQRIRPLANRTGLARLDVVSGRQTADGRRVAEAGAEELGVARASADFDGDEGGV